MPPPPDRYYTRSEIGYQLAGPGGFPMARPVAEVYIHHEGDGLPPTKTTAESLAKARSNQLFHVNVRGWADIAYSFMVDDQGNVLEGRGWNRTGAHTENFNSKGYGICWLGDSRFAAPTDLAVQAYAETIRWGIEDGWLVASPTIVSHSERVATDCCGAALRARIPDIRTQVATGTTPTPTPDPGDDLMLSAFLLPAGDTVYVHNPATGYCVRLDQLGLNMAAYNELVSRGMARPFDSTKRLSWEANALLAYMDAPAAFSTPRAPRP